MFKKIVMFILLIAWIFVIAGLSGEVGVESKDRGAQVAKLVKIFISNGRMPFDYSIVNDDKVLMYVIRKLGHVLTYFVLALLIYTFLCQTRLSRGKALMLTIIFSMMGAALDEYNQLHVSGRDGTVMDILIDSIGVIAALILSSTISQITAKLPEKT
ncbi:MAG TPA: VanZ family protein [Clostridia bacterium]|nr:VanZ family protein [Clostridia bacterium]